MTAIPALRITTVDIVGSESEWNSYTCNIFHFSSLTASKLHFPIVSKSSTRKPITFLVHLPNETRNHKKHQSSLMHWIAPYNKQYAPSAQYRLNSSYATNNSLSLFCSSSGVRMYEHKLNYNTVQIVRINFHVIYIVTYTRPAFQLYEKRDQIII